MASIKRKYNTKEILDNIDLDSDRYNGFASFIISNSKNEISDDKYYFVRAIEDEKGIFRKCRCSIDRAKCQGGNQYDRYKQHRR